ncbi:unnamed protein product [Nyctereutes procyonoides]|uniref:(raccoon dog) hypothetical protein n=1 Tax=Nyctereutes procyonoides TaxID=34880 RepID=A0A811Y835_NYCPR|nr:unnamed protein product [Nyctereutes procyonoides]
MCVGRRRFSPAEAPMLTRCARRDAPRGQALHGGPPLVHCAQGLFVSQTEGELKVTRILKENFPGATAIQVTDISGEFKEKRTIQQHQMINQALKEEIKSMHRLRIFTSNPKH